jgi:hypothetical protein
MLSGAALLLAWGTSAQGASLDLHPVRDNTIYSESGNSNALGGLFAGRTPVATVRRALIAFDIAASIPAGSTINSVTLTITQTKIGPGIPAEFDLHPVLSAWGEGTSFGSGLGDIATAGDATWADRLYGTAPWAAVGGDFGPASASTSMGTSNTGYAFSSPEMAADVQGWLDVPASSFGWLLKAQDESQGVVTARQFGSRESGVPDWPTLTIDFTAPVPVPEPSATMILCAGAGIALASRLRKGRPRG